MPAEQSYKNHTRFDPAFHFVLIPVLLANLLLVLYLLNKDSHVNFGLHLWWLFMAFALLLLALKARMYALKNQDRTIRLEERLRLTALLPAPEHAAIDALTTPQLVALRFASDSELPTLARRALAETLTPKQIKAAITTWRPDYQRI